MKTLLVLTIFLTSSNLLAHLGHTWLGDKAAYEYTLKKKSIFSNNQKRMNLIKESLSITEISESFLKSNLEVLSGVKATSGGDMIKERKSSRGREKSRAFLKEKFEAIGFKVREEKFFRGKNFIAEKKSFHPDAKVVILTAHYDSVGNAGANDNGTGVIGTLAIANALKDMSFKNTLRIIAFDREESGLLGSKAYVKGLSSKSKKNIIGNINFEMMGTNSRKDGAFHIIDCDRKDSLVLTEAVLDTIKENALSLVNNPGCTNRSDHASFWKANIPAIVISENFFGGDSDSCYHRKCDVVDGRLDFSYMKKITFAVYGAVSKLLVPIN